MFKKGTKLESALRFFVNGKWIFDTENVKSLWKKLSENDRKLFNFDITSFTWDEMLTIHIVGGQKYILNIDVSEKEQEETNRKMKR